jgi:hypothetical protein
MRGRISRKRREKQKTLKDYGISDNESSLAQKVARVAREFKHS